MGSQPRTKGCLVAMLLLASLHDSCLAQRRGGNRGLARGASRQTLVQRGGRELAGYGAGGGGGGVGNGGGGPGRRGGGGKGDQQQYGNDQQKYGNGNGDECESEKDTGGAGGGVDFSGCTEDPDTGFCCVEKTECVASVEKDPILECSHRNVEQCHYTYVTTFTPSQEEVCEENFEKTCSITFGQQAFNETVKKCYTPVEKVCNGQGEQQCTTVYESACTTKYVEKAPGKFVGDTKCEKLPTELCGAGCEFQEGNKECHDKQTVAVVEVPEEVCDLNPQKTCRFATKLVPKLMPKHECTIIPKETCILKFTTPRQTKKPLLTKWCLDPQEPTPGESYDESNARGPVLSSGSAPRQYSQAPPTSAQNSYLGPAAESYDSPVYSPTTSQAFPPTGSYSSGSGSGSGLDYSSGLSGDYDYDSVTYDSPSSQAADVYSAPSSGGYDAPPADTGYSAPIPGGTDYGAPTAAGTDYAGPTAAASGYAPPNSVGTNYGGPTTPLGNGYGAPSNGGGGFQAAAASASSYNSPPQDTYSSSGRRKNRKLKGQEGRTGRRNQPKRNLKNGKNRGV